MTRYIRHIIALVTLVFAMSSCIEPPLHLAGDRVIIELPIVQTEMTIVWNIDTDWETNWYYGWDMKDSSLFGPIEYPTPTNFEVRRYFLGTQPGLPHTWNGRDAFTIYGNHFSRYYNFGYYDLLLWSNIDSPDGTQVVVINEDNLENVEATTTGTRGMTRLGTDIALVDSNAVVGLFNQPEIFYGSYSEDIFISRNKEDYDYYDSINNVYVKRLNATLRPLVYIYLVQIIIYNNDGRIRGVSGNNAISGLASTTSINTGHTGSSPCLVYFGSRMKQGIMVNDRTADIIGGKLTTYGLCDMESYAISRGAGYTGSRQELTNMLYFDLEFSNSTTATLQYDVTDQMQSQSHGGVITVVLNAREIEPPHGDGDAGSLFVPTVEDYDEVVWDIEF